MALGAILAAVAIGANALGGYLGSKASTKVAGIQAEAGRAGLNLQREQFQNALKLYNEGRADLAPYRDTGAGAVTTLAKLYGIPTPGNPNAEAFSEAAADAFRRSPDYKFAFDEGSRITQFSAAARGALASGNTLRDLTDYGQRAATTNFQNYAERLLSLARMGQNAATSGASFGAQFGNQAASFANAAADQLGYIGQAQASGVVGSANAWNSALGGVTNNLMLYNLLNQQNNPSAYAGSMSGYDPS